MTLNVELFIDCINLIKPLLFEDNDKFLISFAIVNKIENTKQLSHKIYSKIFLPNILITKYKDKRLYREANNDKQCEKIMIDKLKIDLNNIIKNIHRYKNNNEILQYYNENINRIHQFIIWEVVDDVIGIENKNMMTLKQLFNINRIQSILKINNDYKDVITYRYCCIRLKRDEKKVLLKILHI